jgi:1,4-dihydroxy-2-naphthoyl-CoA synthase
MGLEALAMVDGMDADRAMSHMHSQLSLNLMLDDASEGISAFLARRPPQWKGR